MADDERRAKRSRFDQTEPDHRRQSRFDRRSRSPTSRQSDSVRQRSPLSKDPRSPAAEASAQSAGSQDPAAAAGNVLWDCFAESLTDGVYTAAAAAKINEQLNARKMRNTYKAPQTADVPPASSESPAAKTAPSADGSTKLDNDVYVADGDYIKDIDVNGLRNRYALTRGSTQRMIKEETGADVTTRGSYYPDRSMATPTNPPLYLHVTSTTREGLDKAIEKIEELMKQELPNLVDERRFRRREEQPQVERDEFGRRKWPEERIPIDLEPIPGFNLRAQVVGQGGAYVKHIQQKTGCKVQIKGRGSGFREHGTDRESDEPMYLHVAGPDPEQVKVAKELCLDLLSNVGEQYQRFKENPPQHNYGGYGQRGERHYGGGHGGGGYSGGYGGGYHHHNQQHQHQQSPAAAASMSPSGPSASAESTPGATPGATTDYAAQYSQYYNGQDPYAAYGGYQNYVAYYQYYQQWAQQQQQQQGGAADSSAAATTAAAPHPPPSSSTEPPPPPPGAGGSGSPPPPPPPPGGGSYNAVPPPPGL
ncbi:hypothetical protein UA08_05671 [Talaromyces atroroseus]|uniref:K Homology domain-containing protein n=1 Tax=Talaromyces atroroseus TaxID=1441469 RepID=A0A225AVL4_TALAT|nr:hypothetical protein UA08_05671 [Talaromyces atroroseus]OKL59006.1 hypothetical protein UA08_05671 [Talaromyces atroroseus]